ncbi:flavin reductase family protein [Cohnella yongneupensis]|uniref:Flavin reductase family protein n=1 Tax=Cohnella yongneupensis TaxID=425006 RepID=A0ABW0R764_9BACL
MQSIDPANLSDRDNYKLLIGSVIPRPIAFVTTLSSDGVVNAAPFSYFNIVSSNPPLLSIAVQRKNGVQKDTARNAIATGQLVIHISDETYIAQINETAANLPPDESEVTLAGLKLAASEKVAVPGIAEARIRMECVLEQVIPLGGKDDGHPSTDLLIARVVHYHFDQAVYNNGYIDADALKPVSRLAGNTYAKLGEQFEIVRPS